MGKEEGETTCCWRERRAGELGREGRVRGECSRVGRTVYRLGEKEWREVEDQGKERLVEKIRTQQKINGARD